MKLRPSSHTCETLFWMCIWFRQLCVCARTYSPAAQSWSGASWTARSGPYWLRCPGTFAAVWTCTQSRTLAAGGREEVKTTLQTPHTHTHTRCLECVTSAHACDSDLEFGDHAGLGVVAGAVLVDQTFGQHLGVKLLENVFVLDVLEHNHLREETAWSLWFHCKTKTSPYREARVTASHHLVQSVLQFSLLWVFGAEKETKTNKMLF